MKNLLFPSAFQAIGWILFVPSLIVGALLFVGLLCLSGMTETIVNDMVIIGIAAGALFIVCSKERMEDEMVRAIRLASLLNSIYAYIILLVICTIFINGIDFLIYAVFNMVLLPILFVCNFRLEIHRYKKMCRDEEQD